MTIRQYDNRTEACTRICTTGESWIRYSSYCPGSPIVLSLRDFAMGLRVDLNGVIVAEYTYDAFGRTISQFGPMAEVFRHRFSTKCYDEETGFYYYGYRYYFPELRRWLSRDPLEEEGGNNLYAMLGNNSISDFDSTGEIGNKNKDKAWNFVARWHESHSWNCYEWKHLRGKHMSGTKDKYIEHFEKYTFVGNKKVSESAKAGFSYSIPNALRMDQNPSYCWCAELDFVLEINARGQYRLKMHVQTLDVHPTCCEKPENHVSGLEGRNFTLGPY